MTQEPKHTPGKWIVNDSKPDNITIVADEWTIATISCQKPSVPRWDFEAQANAKFIVRACNSHDDLLAALESMLLAHKVLVDFPNDNKVGMAALASRQKAQALITKVKGESQ